MLTIHHLGWSQSERIVWLCEELGQDQGPRMGSFTGLYGWKETANLIRKVLKGESLSAA